MVILILFNYVRITPSVLRIIDLSLLMFRFTRYVLKRLCYKNGFHSPSRETLIYNENLLGIFSLVD